MTLLPVSGRVIIPKEIQDIARAGLFKKSEWRKVFKYVERGAMGQGGILEQNLKQPDVQAPLAPSTIERKRRQGLPETALVGKKGRIQKALSSANSSLRKRTVQIRKNGGVVFRVGFNPSKFPMAGSKEPFTRVLQRGRIAGATLADGQKIGRAKTVLKAKKKLMKDVTAVHRMPGRPVLSYYPGNEGKLTPALLKAVYQVLKEKGLSE